MILYEKLYTIKTQTAEEGKIDFLVGFNTDYEILKGHFPGNPIIPGACIIQILSELLSLYVGYEVIVSEAKKIKFTNLINPINNNEVTFSVSFSLNDDEIKTTTTVHAEEITFAKLSALFKRAK